MSFAWSYSQLTSFETCPRRYYLLSVAKTVKEPQSDELLYGNRVHKAMENRLKTGEPLPGSMMTLEPYAQAVIAKPGQRLVEQKYAITDNFEQTTWFAKDVWARSVADAIVINGDKLAVLDWKTGNKKPDSAQLRMSAAMMFHIYPYVQTVTTAFVWLKDKDITSETLTRNDLPEVWADLLPRVKRLEIARAENKFPPKPSGICRKWCPVGKHNCEHCGS